MRSDFAVFILTHGRPDNVMTYQTLRRRGYTGRIVLLVDDEDTTLDRYRANYGDEVVVFSKDEAATLCDPADLSTDRRTPLYARNISWQIAASMGLDYFAQYDDDYAYFSHRWIEEDKPIRNRQIWDMDEVLERLLVFLDDTGADCVAMGQGGDYIGGSGGVLRYHVRRKVMNTFMFRTDRRLPFLGRLNDDVNMYVMRGSRGALLLTVLRLRMDQPPTQTQDGGLTDTYRASGTYWKSFSTVMMHPSSVGIRILKGHGGGKQSHARIHHEVNWRRTVPLILSDRYRKEPAHG